MGCCERFGDLPRDRHGLVLGQWPARDPIGQRRALDKLQDQRVSAIGFFEAEN
jgi:hypothetical protein